jgi:RHS repeat-associated protein
LAPPNDFLPPRQDLTIPLGNITSDTNPEVVDVLFGFTGRQFDRVSGLQNNLNRWYDAGVGRWISEDPIGFAGGDANLVRYVGNRVVSNESDPDGLKPRPGTRPPSSWPDPGSKWKWDKGSGRYNKGGRWRHWDTTPGHRPHWDEENKDGTGHENIYVDPAPAPAPAPDPAPGNSSSTTNAIAYGVGTAAVCTGAFLISQIIPIAPGPEDAVAAGILVWWFGSSEPGSGSGTGSSRLSASPEA